MQLIFFIDSLILFLQYSHYLQKNHLIVMSGNGVVQLICHSQELRKMRYSLVYCLAGLLTFDLKSPDFSKMKILIISCPKSTRMTRSDGDTVVRCLLTV